MTAWPYRTMCGSVTWLQLYLTRVLGSDISSAPIRQYRGTHSDLVCCSGFDTRLAPTWQNINTRRNLSTMDLLILLIVGLQNHNVCSAAKFLATNL